MEWTQDHVLELVNLLYGKPELWDQKGNRNKQLQIEATNDIALQMGRNVREVERKLNYLRAQFSREWLRVRRAKQNNEEYEPKWFAFRPLSFLIYKRHINKPIQDKDREDLMEQSIYFTPYERKLLDVIESNEFEGIVPELNVSAELATTTPTSIAEIVKKPIEIKARRRSTRKSTPSVKKELYDEQLELLENENLLLSANETPISTVSVKKNVAQQNMTQQNVAQQNMTQQNMIQQNVAQQNMLQQNVAQQNMIQQNDAQQNMIQQNMAQQNVAQQNMTQQNIAQQDKIQQDIIQQNIIQQNTPKNHLSPVEHPMKKMRMEKNKQKLRHTPTVRYRNYDLINAKLKFVALQKKFLLQEHQKKEEINRLQLEHEKYKLEITKLEVEKKKLDIQIRSKMVE